MTTKSNADRQREYRERQKQAGSERLNVVVDLHAKRALERLASYYGVTQKNMLEQLITAAQRQALDEIPNEQQSDYFDLKLRRNSNSGG